MKNIGKLAKEDKLISREDAHTNMMSDLMVGRLEFMGGVGFLATGVYLLTQSLERVAGYVASSVGIGLFYDCYRRVKRSA